MPCSRPDPLLFDKLRAAVSARLAQGGSRPLVVGICGAQGSGKTTLADALAQAFVAEGVPTATLSLDDLYLSHGARAELARKAHPLFATRGVPGTHDVALGLEVLAALDRGEAVPLPRFDKGSDDPLPRADWPRAPAGTALVLLEGWCLGARPQAEAALAAPVNALEAGEDPQGLWRGHANRALAGAYQALFARIDLLVLLAAPGFEVVARWRGQAEEALRAAGAARAMDPAAIARFVAHYERLTRHILAEMPQRADIVARLDEDRACRAVESA